MPELPEVETIRRQLEPRVVDRSIAALDVVDALLTAPQDPALVAAAVVGERITGIERHGKYLEVILAHGDSMALHLRMTGRLHWRPTAPSVGAERFLRATLHLDDGATITIADARRFGRVWHIPSGIDRRAYWADRVGVEPLGGGFTARRFGDLLAGRRVAIKPALLNQRIVAGLGNMYVDEALYAAGVHPLRMAGSLDDGEIRSLHRAIRDRLRVAIDAGGASIDTYRDGLGQPGRMQQLLRVHLHEGDPCLRCDTTIVKTVVAQRGTYWCPRCQPNPPGALPPTPGGRPRRIRQGAI
jgi:formamidopyrimidine-DNA glycosylase